MEGASSALETPQFEMEMAKIEMDYMDADEDHFEWFDNRQDRYAKDWKQSRLALSIYNSDTFYRF